jgi:sulfatase modifying factor 1
MSLFAGRASRRSPLPSLRAIVSRSTTIVTLMSLTAALSHGSSASSQVSQGPQSPALVPMVVVPAGSFIMGNTGSTNGEPHELPRHSVRVASFAIGRFEVTQAAFEAVMGHNPSEARGPTRPVEQISWFDAVRFCNALSRRDGLAPAYQIHPFQGYILDPVSNGYRLPTELEWEYAAKAGTGTDTYAGNLAAREGADPGLDRIAWYRAKEVDDSTHPVGLKQPNAFGLYDVIGNVFEWTDTPFRAYPGGRLTAGTPGSSEGEDLKVLRGGAIDTNLGASRAAYRYRLHPSYTSYNIGFRIARRLGP